MRGLLFYLLPLFLWVKEERGEVLKGVRGFLRQQDVFLVVVHQVNKYYLKDMLCHSNISINGFYISDTIRTSL